MSNRFLRDTNLSDIQREMSRMLQEGSRDPSVRRLAELAVRDNSDQIGAVHQFVKRTFPYQPDPSGTELFVHPRKVAEDYFQGRTRRFDCDDAALLTVSMLSSLGRQARVVLVDIKGEGLDHAFAEVNTPLGWIAVDTVSSRPLGWVQQFRQRIVID